MFTGIIQDLGKVIKMTPLETSIEFTIQPLSSKFLRDVKTGDSISVNGACMTVEKKVNGNFEFTAIHESLRKTNLSSLKTRDLINLEKAMTLNSKLDGHIVQGHVDTTGTVKKIISKKNCREFLIQFHPKYKSNVITVGSIAINGVSLTIAEIVKETSAGVLIRVAIIPHTFDVTNFSKLKEKDKVNIEFDMLGKYAQRIVSKKKVLK